MNTGGSQSATPSPPTVMCSGGIRERDPPGFNGADENDAEDWLASFERVSTHNQWNEAMKLSKVSFSLHAVAELWYGNNAHRFKTWADFKADFLFTFGRPAVRKLHAEQRLRERAQRAGETFTSYIEDVVDLCKRINSNMTEHDKVKHILKGIDDDAFQMLLAKNPQTVSDIISNCLSYEELRKERALTRRKVMHEPLASLATDANENPAMLQHIQQLVREEVARQLSLLPYTEPPRSPLAATVRHVIQEQVAEGLPCVRPHPPVAAPLTYADNTARPFADVAAPRIFHDATPTPYAEVAARPRVSFPMAAPPITTVRPSPRSGYQAGNPWRTADNRPICFSCCVPGHVARYCRRNMVPPRGIPPNSYRSSPPFNVPPTRPLLESDPSDHRDFNNRRSMSPRRRSLSPMRRRPASSDAEN